MVLPRLPNFHCPCGGTSATAVDVATGAAVAVDDDNAVGAVVPPSSTKDKGTYVGASVAFEGTCVSAFADGAGEFRSLRAAATTLLPTCCALPPRFALPPPPLTLPPPPRCRQAAAYVALSRCRHCRSIHNAAIALPPSRCLPPPHFALPPPPLTLPLPPCHRQASADVALARCHHH